MLLIWSSAFSADVNGRKDLSFMILLNLARSVIAFCTSSSSTPISSDFTRSKRPKPDGDSYNKYITIAVRVRVRVRDFERQQCGVRGERGVVTRPVRRVAVWCADGGQAACAMTGTVVTMTVMC
jgi:hypothetical protein